MWIIANGAPKTGSTWIVQLLNATRCFQRIPKKLQNPKWVNSSIIDEISTDYSNILASSNLNYLSKQHWSDRNKELLELSGIRVLNTIRDLRDTLVSRYYHDVRLSGVTEPISEYLKEREKPLVRQYCSYQSYWIEAGAHHPKSYHISSYERLSDDPITASRELFAFCGLELSATDVSRAVDATSFEKKDSGHGKFFRKGKVHAFTDDLSGHDNELIITWAESYDLRTIKNRIAKFNLTLKPYLQMTDVGLG